MPTATKFMADGVGNGFPFCPPKVDVSGFGKWTNLGGYNKDDADSRDPTAEEISLSRKNAMNLFWGANGFSGSYTGDYDETVIAEPTLDLFTGDYDYSEWIIFGNPTDDDVNREPMERVCYLFFLAGKWHDGFPGSNEDSNEIRMKVEIYRMYDGVTTNEDNFVGYGWDQLFIAADEFGDRTMLVQSAAGSPPGDEGDLEYVFFSGAYHVVRLYDGLLPPDIEGVDYSISVVGDSIVGTIEDGETFVSEMTINPIDFYTY